MVAAPCLLRTDAVGLHCKLTLPQPPAFPKSEPELKPRLNVLVCVCICPPGRSVREGAVGILRV